MNQIHKKRIQKWVDALKSGKYKQGKGLLKTKDGLFCCLGVACDVYSHENGAKIGWQDDEEGSTFLDRRDLLPMQVVRYYGLNGSDPKVGKSRDKSLILLNDAKHKSFKQIAGYIERAFLK